MVYEILRTLTQLQSLALTAPLIALCVVVVWEVLKPTRDLVKKKKLTVNEHRLKWVFIGILIGFIGKIIESAWWAIPWTLDYLDIDKDNWKKIHGAGVFFNLIFRQLFFTISAYCYLRAFIAPEKEDTGLRNVHWIFGMSLILGQLYLIALIAIRSPLE